MCPSKRSRRRFTCASVLASVKSLSNDSPTMFCMRKRMVSENQLLLGRNVMPLPTSRLGMLRRRSRSSASLSSESAVMTSVRLSGERSCAAAIEQQLVSRSRRSVFFISVLSVFSVRPVPRKNTKNMRVPVNLLQSWKVNLKRI